MSGNSVDPPNTVRGMEIFLVDAFTDDAFHGNPAAVVLLDGPADPDWMRSVAAEMNQSETAFVVDAPAGEPKPLRWFTPTTEVELCGHATLATAHALGGDQRFDTLSGELTCTNTDGVITMDFPADVPEPVEPPEWLLSGLPGVTAREAAQGSSKLLVRAGSAAEVRALEPDFDLLRRAEGGVIVTAEGDREGVDFVSRFFAPSKGIPEDPVTGSAHCTLAAWWSVGSQRTELRGEQASTRGGFVRMRPRGTRVEISGRAVTVLRGALLG